MSLETVRLDFDDAAGLDRWQSYIHARPDSHCADLAEWRLLFRELYGFEDHSYACIERDRVVGAFSLYHIRSPLMGKMLVSCPFFGYGGLYWETDPARDALLERAEATARELGVDYIELRLRRELPRPYRSNTDFAEFNLNLASTPQETWSACLSGNVRQNVRKSQKCDLGFRLSADYRPCYNLLRRTIRAHGTPFHDRRFFDLLTRHLGERVRFAEVRKNDDVIAGGVVIRFKDTIITPYIGSLARSRPLRPNYRQYWGLIETAHAESITRFEMGRSPRESTHARFKSKWGCEELPLHYNYLVTNPRRPYRTVSRPTRLQRWATRAWKHMPLPLATFLGPRLFRYIP